jgi:hypothetical protein
VNFASNTDIINCQSHAGQGICLATQIARKALKLGENGVTDFGWLAENSSLTYVARFKHFVVLTFSPLIHTASFEKLVLTAYSNTPFVAMH